MTRWAMAMGVVLMAVAFAPIRAQELRLGGEQPESRFANHQLVVFYVDLTTLSRAELNRVADTASKFIEARRGGTQLFALISFDGRSARVQQDFTADAASMETALDQLPASPAAADSGPRLKALETAIRVMGSLPQKKALVLFGTPAADDSTRLDQMIQTAIRANVAIYPIDVRGLVGHNQ